MVKILCVITSGLTREGIVSTQLEYLKNMNLDGIEMHVLSVSSPADGVVEEFENLGCKVIQMPNRLRDLLKYRSELKKLMKREKYDVIHVHGSSALMVNELGMAKKLKVPMRIAHSRNTMCTYEKIDKLLRPMFYKSYNLALACGKDAGQWLFPDRDFEVLHNGKNLKKFAYNEEERRIFREKLSLDGKIAVGFVGRISYQKNMEFLISVFNDYHNRIPNSRLYIMGDGEQKEMVKGLIEHHGLENDVVFTGNIKNVNEYLQAMDIMLLPSRFEGLPNVVLEWQICGLPTLVSNTVTEECKTTELVKFLPTNEGTSVWCDAMENIDLAADRGVASEISVKRMKEEKFDIEEGANYLRNLYLSAKKNI